MTSMFVDRMKNDPKFAAEAFRLQSAIASSSDPANQAQTYFGQNNDLTLDTRKEGHTSAFTDAEMDSLGLDDSDFSSYRQQATSDASHPRYGQVTVIAQGLAFVPAEAADAGPLADVFNKAYNKAEVCHPAEKFRTGDVADEPT
eukprot:CAMPEP_0182455710 /NCGR_PEP_ID=MMETSP1319-20130603/1798_1 /TAXON_ID=172717 /ORGANISM="Bolidomonas pacifica, Strain RCC208" /LENGTH=143 /DNA_ID=CAMNT_0024653833 /DNA_START=17 /DNA_END=445 /DNA_ORIENTATION=-